MAERLHRVSPADLEIRGDDGRTVVGIAVPFDQPAEVRSLTGRYTEVFRRGAFARTIAERGPERVKFLAMHDRERMPLGRATLLREDQAGLYGEFRVSKTTAGDEALELIRDGALDALSVSFKPVRDQWNQTRSSVERIEAALAEVSATAFPVYSGAAVLGVRSEDDPADPAFVPPVTVTEARSRLAALSPVSVADARRRLDLLTGRNFPR